MNKLKNYILKITSLFTNKKIYLGNSISTDDNEINISLNNYTPSKATKKYKISKEFVDVELYGITKNNNIYYYTVISVMTGRRMIINKTLFDSIYEPENNTNGIKNILNKETIGN